MTDLRLNDLLIASATAAIAEEASRHREEFAAAYLTMTNIDPRDAVLVEERDRHGVTITTRWYYVHKADLRGDEDVRAIVAENERLRAQLDEVRRCLYEATRLLTQIEG